MLAQLSDATKPLRHSVKLLTSSNSPKAFPAWDWATGLPVGAQRADLFAPTVAHQAVAHFCPSVIHQHMQFVSSQQQPVRLASTSVAPAGFSITNVNGTTVENLQDLFFALEQTKSDKDGIQVDFVSAADESRSSEFAAAVQKKTLDSLAQTMAEGHSVLTVVDQGNPWFVIRDGAVRARVMIRTDRRRGLLQIAASITNCWAQPIQLPVEIKANCNDAPLYCLSADDTLQLLYARENVEKDVKNSPESTSFARASEREGYLIPTNYNSLHEELVNEVRDDRTLAPRDPALASLPGISYPGPAILGDARALSGFLLQRKVLKPGDDELFGWVMFAGEELVNGGVVDIGLDVGNGMRTLRFRVPEL